MKPAMQQPVDKKRWQGVSSSSIYCFFFASKRLDMASQMFKESRAETQRILELVDYSILEGNLMIKNGQLAIQKSKACLSEIDAEITASKTLRKGF